MRTRSEPTRFDLSESWAIEADRRDPLSPLREKFLLPLGPDGLPAAYFCGHSLGLQPRGVAGAVTQELDDWARLGVAGHFRGRRPWFNYHAAFRESGARLVGAVPGEVVMMNSLTVNLHLMMASFYRPTPQRHKILMESCAFPSDTYAVRAQLAWHGFDPDEGLIVVEPRTGESTLHADAIDALLSQRGDEIALVLWSGVQYFTGQWFDLERLTRRAHEAGCVVGLDLAHAVGNVPLELHDWRVDFAVWCSYKYLNAGPGAVAGCFVHECHGDRDDLPRLAGWWGHDPERRFRMHLETTFRPQPGAEGWQLSNPPILSLAPLAVALGLFEEAGLQALREKSVQLTGYLEAWIDHAASPDLHVLTPRDPGSRGCQLSLAVGPRARALAERLAVAGIVVDVREPDVVRLAPVPSYNSFHDVWRLGRVLAQGPSGG